MGYFHGFSFPVLVPLSPLRTDQVSLETRTAWAALGKPTQRTGKCSKNPVRSSVVPCRPAALRRRPRDALDAYCPPPGGQMPCEVGWEEITLLDCQGAPSPAPRLSSPRRLITVLWRHLVATFIYFSTGIRAKSASVVFGLCAPGRTPGGLWHLRQSSGSYWESEH